MAGDEAINDRLAFQQLTRVPLPPIVVVLAQPRQDARCVHGIDILWRFASRIIPMVASRAKNRSKNRSNSYSKIHSVVICARTSTNSYIFVESHFYARSIIIIRRSKYIEVKSKREETSLIKR